MNKPVRTRYAPSPTGFPHVGNIRTALFSWLFARHHGGHFIVRIEDTDVARKVDGAVEAILGSLRWLEMDWDEGPEMEGDYGPYLQSQRLELYREAAERLVAQGYAYYCYCSPQRLVEMRAEQSRSKQSLGYDRRCRDLSGAEIVQKKSEGVTPVIRFQMPLQGQTSFADIIRGTVVFENNQLDDFVLLKSDGYPTYHLANVVDDHLMEISHVIRAEEWLSSVPRHKLLYQALRYELPQMAHLPMILGPDRAKMSKRHGAVSIIEYQKQGYLPEAMLSFLALLGWSLDDKTDIISRDELMEYFSLERVSKTAAIFNQGKLDWMNGVFLRELSHKELSKKIMPFLESGLPKKVKRPVPEEYVSRIVPLIRERINTLAEAAIYADFFFLDELEYDASLLIGKKMTTETTLKALKAAQERLTLLESFDRDLLEDMLRLLAEKLGLKSGQLFSSLRVAATGRAAAPPLFETMAVLGKDRCLQRLKVALRKMG
ncbi:MAG: glutamate--tRNA ligase [Dehalococcoidales bacterium]|jgi:glutamyl-tRNA synthetase|nr:glutamate--tRNA ligase [Dehalococcoidales bacterium]